MTYLKQNIVQPYVIRYRYWFYLIIGLGLVVALLILLVPDRAISYPVPIRHRAPSAIVAGVSDSYLINKTNQYRNQSGLPALAMSDKLMTAAYAKAKDMDNGEYFDHISPTGKTPWDFIHENDYEYTFAGENLAIDFNNLDAAFQAWLNSPSHRGNLANPNYSQTGLAATEAEISGRKTIVIVQLFASPQSLTDQIVTNLNQ